MNNNYYYHHHLLHHYCYVTVKSAPVNKKWTKSLHYEYFMNTLTQN